MPDAVQAVESERQSQRNLGQDLGDNRPGRERSSNYGRFNVPSQHWGDQVQSAVEVEDAADRAARDAVQGGEVPGDLGTVDGEMRRDGAVEALVRYLITLC